MNNMFNTHYFSCCWCKWRFPSIWSNGLL